MCWRLRICFNLDTGFKSWTRIGPRSGRRWRKNKYRPERECSTAFSIKSTIVLLLNLVRLPKLKLPEITNATLQSRHYEKCIKASLQSFSHHKTRKEAYSQDQALITPFFLLGHIFETTRPQNKDQLCQNSRAFKIFHSSSRENYTISWSLKIPSVLVVL